MTPLFIPGLLPGRFVNFVTSLRASSAPASVPVSTFVPELPRPEEPFETWATWAVWLTGTSAQVPRPVATDWETWAAFFVEAPELAPYNLPAPAGFRTWLEWAIAARQAFTGA